MRIRYALKTVVLNTFIRSRLNIAEGPLTVWGAELFRIANNQA